jgi:hypothetical protein
MALAISWDLCGDWITSLASVYRALADAVPNFAEP